MEGSNRAIKENEASSKSGCRILYSSRPVPRKPWNQGIALAGTLRNDSLSPREKLNTPCSRAQRSVARILVRHAGSIRTEDAWMCLVAWDYVKSGLVDHQIRERRNASLEKDPGTQKAGQCHAMPEDEA